MILPTMNPLTAMQLSASFHVPVLPHICEQNKGSVRLICSTAPKILAAMSFWLSCPLFTWAPNTL